MSETDTGASALEPSLPATTGDGAARARALTEARNTAIAPTGLVSYVSSGRLALIGSVAESSSAAERIEGTLEAVIVAPPGDAASGPGVARVLHAAITAVEGHLGAFTLHAESDGSPIVVAPSPLTGNKPFDIVIDLRLEPAFAHEILPPGYFAPRGDEAALAEAIEQAADLVGEFEKPRYFGYDPDICAHGAAGIRGCTRCLDACPTGAIRSIGERVEVNPYLCQGGRGLRERVSNRSDDLCVSAAGRSARGAARGSRRLPGSRGTGAGAPVLRCGDRGRPVARCARGA